jgi:DNA polymerase-3 subunit epsilon
MPSMKEAHVIDNAAQTVAALEATGNYRVLRRLLPRARSELRTSSATRLGLFLDIETTGIDQATDEIIELAMVPFTYSLDGAILAVGAPFSALNEPSVPVSPGITALTGITQEMVAGHRIDPDAVERFVAPAALVIAHHAGFDRPFVERSWPVFETKPWACSMNQIPWKDEGFDGVKLRYLAMLSGFFYDAHRATADCDAAVELLSRPLPRSQRRALAVLLEAARQPTYRVWAENSPFEQKDVLKRRGYRWNADIQHGPRAWYVDVQEQDLDTEREFLSETIYGRETSLRIAHIDASCRFAARDVNMNQHSTTDVLESK